jgi:hypothetical protein
VRDILNLAISGLSDGPGAVKQMYSWHFDHVSDVIRISLGSAATLIVAILVAAFSDKFKATALEVVLTFTGASLIALLGMYNAFRLRSIQADYAASLRLYEQGLRLAPFLKRYLEQSR